MKISLINFSILLFCFFLLLACESHRKLPFLGEKDIKTVLINGKSQADTIYHTIPSFSFTNQYGKRISNADFLNKRVYIADFFFTSCPTICPKMKSQMNRLYKHFKGNMAVGFLSHSIDPRHDTVPVLAEYAKNLGVEGNQWQFVTGIKEDIYRIGLKGYMATAKEDSTAEGGFIHSGAFILVDKLQRVRGIYDGTVADEVDQLQKDLELLLKEK
jgi:protein SCO1